MTSVLAGFSHISAVCVCELNSTRKERYGHRSIWIRSPDAERSAK